MVPRTGRRRDRSVKIIRLPDNAGILSRGNDVDKPRNLAKSVTVD